MRAARRAVVADAAGPDRSGGWTASARKATNGSTRPPTPGWSRMPSTITGSCITAPPRAGICATPICSRRSASCSRPRGPSAKAVVWAHNSHIGDAALHRDGPGARGAQHRPAGQASGSATQARLIGFGTHTGTVAAATDWDGPMEVKRVRPSLPDSYERLCHDSGVPPLPARPARGQREAAARALCRAPARALHRRHLPPRDRALEPLFRGGAAQPVRRLGVVRRDRRR